MDFLIKLYNFLTTVWNTPKLFGVYHIICILSIIVLTSLICSRMKDCSDGTERRFCAAVWLIMLLFEIYKQLIHGLSVEDGKFVWDYAWYIFPFQFCSSPLYILPIIAFAKSEKLRDACAAYLITFSLFAGLAVFCYPGDVFTETVGVNLQTMVHHGSQILIGVFLAVKYKEKFERRFFFGGVAVFVVMTFVAMALNIAAHYAFIEYGIDETFNMFYISPYFDCTLPLLSVVYQLLPYAAFICVYFFGFILCSLIVYGIVYGFARLIERNSRYRARVRYSLRNKQS